MRLVSELRRRNVLRMLVLYVVAAWLIMQVAEVLIDLAKLPDWIGTTTLWLLAVGFPIALIFSWFYEITPEGVSLEKDVAPGESITQVTGRRLDFLVISMLCAAVILFAYDKWWIGPPPENSIAVLPFDNMSGNPENEYLSDGITESLLHALAQLSDLKVTARTSVFHDSFKGQDIRAIASQLGVANVLEGSVQRVGDKLRIVAQLIEADTGFHHWSKTYDRDMSDIFAVQDDIANSVAHAMQVTLSGDPDQGGGKIETVGTDNVEVYDLYLKGKQQNNKGSVKSFTLAEVSFKEALALDADFFEARLELAKTYRLQRDTGAIDTVDALEKITPLVDRLAEERPDNGFVLALTTWVQRTRARILEDGSFDIDKHIAQLSAAIERTPNESDLYSSLAYYLDIADRPEESLEWVDRGIAIDPYNWALHNHRGDLLEQAGNLDGEEAARARALELNPDNPRVLVDNAYVHWKRKQYAQWFAMKRKAMDVDPLDAELAAALSIQLHWFGLTDEANAYLQRAIAIRSDDAYGRSVRLYRLMLQDHVRARDMSEAMLRDDIENRWGSYGRAAIVFVSTMTELDKTDVALDVLEELLPGVTSPDFQPQSGKQFRLQYVAVLALAQSKSREETLQLLDTMVPRWDESFPSWREDSFWGAAIELARGNTESAVELALKDLAGGIERVVSARYRHLYYWQPLALESAVAARLMELDAEAKKGGEEIWAYIVENDLQL